MASPIPIPDLETKREKNSARGWSSGPCLLPANQQSRYRVPGAGLRACAKGGRCAYNQETGCAAMAKLWAELVTSRPEKWTGPWYNPALNNCTHLTMVEFGAQWPPTTVAQSSRYSASKALEGTASLPIDAAYLHWLFSGLPQLDREPDEFRVLLYKLLYSVVIKVFITFLFQV